MSTTNRLNPPTVLRLLSALFLTCILGITAQADDEFYYGGGGFYDGGGSGGGGYYGETVVLPPFEVSSGDPATFDWDGYYNYLVVSGTLTTFDETPTEFYAELSVDTGQATSGQSAPQQSTADTQFTQSSRGTCFFASIRMIMSHKGITNIPSESNLVASAATTPTVSRTAAQMEQQGIAKSDIRAALPNILSGTNLTGKLTTIATAPETYTANQALQQFTSSLPNGGFAIGSFFVGRTIDPTTNSLTVQTHAQVLENRKGTVLLWNPEGGSITTLGTVEQAFNTLVGGFRGNSEQERIARGTTTYIVSITP